MKKTLSIVAGLFALLAVSCTQENLENPAAGKEVTVTFCAAVPGNIATKADDYDYSDGTHATKLHYGVYVTGETTPRFQDSTDFNSNLQAVVNLTLATGLSYDFVFWAQPAFVSKDKEVYSINWETRQMTVDYAKIQANDERNDAFYAYVPALQVTGAVNRTIDLYRPFAQINLGTNDYTAAAAAGLEVDRTNMVFAELPNILNFEDGTVEGKVEATFAMKEFDRTETYPVSGYEYLEMNYVLAGAQRTTATLVTFNVWETGKTLPLAPNIQVANVPYQRNYQTNIYGSLLTDPANLTVVIKPAYEESDYDVPADAAAIYAAAKNGGKITLESNLALTEPLVVENDLTVNLNGHTMSYTASQENPSLFLVKNGKTLNVDGTGEMTSDFYVFGVSATGAGTINLNGDIKYTARVSVVNVTNGVVNVKAGEFSVTGDDKRYVLNCVDKHYQSGAAAINVTGGSFVGFDPANNVAEGEGTDYVAEGYVSEKRADADVYDVKIKAGNATVTVTTAEGLRNMLTVLTDSNSGDNKVIIDANIELAEGEVWEPVVIQGYSGAGVITIEGNGHYISGLTAPLFASGFAGESGVIIKKLTIKNSVIPSTTEYKQGDSFAANSPFLCSCQAMELIEFHNCHLDNVTVEGSNYVAGFIGYISGYNKENDGPVETNCVIKDCTVTNCHFTAGGSVGALLGHAGGDYNTIIEVTDCTVSGCTFNQTDNNLTKLGWAIGTVGCGKYTTVVGVTGNGNTFGTDNAALEIKIGRFRPAWSSDSTNPAPYFKVDDKKYEPVDADYIY